MTLDAIEVITLFVDDIDEAKSFYHRAFTPKVLFEDDVSAVLNFSGLLVNLLISSEAPELVTPLPVAASSSGSRMLLTIKVDDTDAVCAELSRLGITLAQRPDRPSLGPPHRSLRRSFRPYLGDCGRHQVTGRGFPVLCPRWTPASPANGLFLQLLKYGRYRPVEGKDHVQFATGSTERCRTSLSGDHCR
jgi:catechol 2,3-dioxygenase-like lactoylglutathione lyase family enzyme